MFCRPSVFPDTIAISPPFPDMWDASVSGMTFMETQTARMRPICRIPVEEACQINVTVSNESSVFVTLPLSMCIVCVTLNSTQLLASSSKSKHLIEPQIPLLVLLKVAEGLNPHYSMRLFKFWWRNSWMAWKSELWYDETVFIGLFEELIFNFNYLL